MTKVTIKKKDNEIVSIECLGHAGYSETEDIVCAALSSVVQTAILGVMAVAGVNGTLSRDDEKGYLSFLLPKDIEKSSRHDASVILNTMVLGIADLEEGYSNYIKLEVK